MTDDSDGGDTMDPLLSAGLAKVGGATIETTQNLVARVLGPAADQIGGALARYTEFRLANVGRIATKAQSKRRDSEGEIPPRVAHKILEEGSYCDDELMAEYLSGLMAGSRTPGARDDRAVVWSQVVTGMSSLQVRAHFLIYREWARLLHGRQDVALGTTKQRGEAQLVVELFEFMTILADESGVDAYEAIVHSIGGVHRIGLLDSYSHGTRESTGVPDSPYPAILKVTMSPTGMELYGWVLGLPGLAPGGFAGLAQAIDVEGVPSALRTAYLLPVKPPPS